MQFCGKCGTKLRIRTEKTDSGSIQMWFCVKCGNTEPVNKSVTKAEPSNASKTSIKVVSEKENIKPMPKVDIECSKCGHGTAFWWMLQTRSADEPQTQFFRCERCNHTWRQYS